MSNNNGPKTENKFSNITGFFAIHAPGAFLNGAGVEPGIDKTNVTVKQFYHHKRLPYVSSQAWRRWLRNTIIEQEGWKESTLEAIEWNSKGNTAKIAGQLNPIDFPEDDLFGYMYAKGKEKMKVPDDKEQRENLPDKQLIRISPFKSSILRGVPDLTFISRDDGFVHLKDDSPVPYSTEFYSGEMVAIFGLDYDRVGVFEKYSSNSEELDPKLVEKYKDKLEINDHPIIGKKGSIINLKENKTIRKERTQALLRSLASLNGGAKLTQFGTDVTPKLIIIAGLDSGNLIFDDLLIAENNKPALNIDALTQIIDDYSDILKTDVYLGVRTGYLVNEAKILELVKNNDKIFKNDSESLLSPKQVIAEFLKNL